VIQELDTVALTQDVEAHGLERGDIGTVLHVYTRETAFEVEFVTGGGSTVALLTLGADAIRPIGKSEILHVRELTESQP